MRHEQYLEVRCCCKPEKLLGWAPVWMPAEHIFIRHPADFRIPEGSIISFDHHTLPIAPFNDGRRRYLAIKAEGWTQTELLARLPGFVPLKTEMGSSLLDRAIELLVEMRSLLRLNTQPYETSELLQHVEAFIRRQWQDQEKN